MSKPLFSLLLLSLLFMNSNSSTNSPSKICSPGDCGNGVNIRYPFWLLDNTTSEQYYCGYRNFGLTCSADGKPILSLSNNTFYVENINYTDYTLTLVDIDLANQTCPRPRQNLTLDTVPLDYSPLDLNLTFYFNCTSALSLSSADAIQCLESGANRSYVSEVESKTDVFDWVGICEEKVVVTVMHEEINVDDLISTFDGAVDKGFVLNWSIAEYCATCESSVGHCGYSDTAEELLCFCQGGTVSKNHCNVGKGILLWFKLLIGIGSAIVGILLIWISICCFRGKVSSNSMVFWQGRTKRDQTIEAFIRNYGSLAPKRYRYSEVKKMTSSFIYKLGQGGYGNVYKGKLINGCPVAVKVLKASKGNGEEFINEVASISRTSHVNVVTLLGFCIEGHKRALIYEFMPNGSLEKFIYNENPLKIGWQLGWEKLQQIATEIARGLEYLHRGCNTRILHFDIKPHNILLDEAFCPKISDFGLAKLCSKKESIISMLGTRGTIGYIAPEVFSRNFGGVSHKSDVYSYGMMVLEMVGGRKNIDVGVAGAGHTSEIYFPHWVYKRLELDNNLRLQGDMSEEDNMIARKMVIVGLWCIQTDPSHRPSMSEVMNMLDGSIDDLQIPPKPYLSSPPRSPANPSTFSTVSIS